MSTKNETPKVPTKRKASGEPPLSNKAMKTEKSEPLPEYTNEKGKQTIIDELVTLLTLKYNELAKHATGDNGVDVFNDELVQVLAPFIKKNNLWLIIEAITFILKTFEQQNGKASPVEAVIESVHYLPKTLSGRDVQKLIRDVLLLF